MKTSWALCCLYQFLAIFAFGHNADDLVLPKGFNQTIDLSQRSQIYVDKSIKLDLASIQQQFKQGNFIDLKNLQLAGKYERGKYAYWLRLPIINHEETSSLLSLNCGAFDSVRVFLINPNKTTESLLVGMKVRRTAAHDQLPFPDPSSAPLNLTAKTPYEIYVRINNEIEINRKIIPTIYNPQYELSHNYFQIIRVYIFQFTFFGLLLFITIVNLFQYIQNRDKSYLFYSLYIFSLLLFFTRDFDFNSPLIRIWPIWFSAHHFLTPLILLNISFYMLFVDSFLDAKNRLPNLHQIVLRGLWVCLVCFVIDRILMLIDPSWAWRFYSFTKIIALAILSVIVFRIVYFQGRLSFFVLTGSIVLLVSTVATGLMSFKEVHIVNWFDVTYIPQYGGILLEVLFFSVGLAYKSRLAEKEKSIMRSKLNLREQEARHQKELNEMRNTFFANISHEFRTPLTIIIGMSKELMRNSNTTAFRKKMGMITDNAMKLLNLVNQMLDLAQLEAKKMKLELTKNDIVNYLEYLVDAYQSYAQSKELDLQFYSEIDELVMNFDEEKLQRVISNLLSNAIKFTQKYGKIILVAKINEEGEENQLEIRVKDNGIGIIPEALPFIFSRFYQAASPAKKEEMVTRQQGTGIGLALVAEIIALMEGRIRVESDPKTGTIFFITLPIQNDPLILPASKKMIRPDKVAATLFPKNKIDTTAISTSLHLNGQPSILIVEDNKDVIYYLQTCLDDTYHCEFATNGQEGLNVAVSNLPDIIISDIMMPVMDGFQLCTALKKDARTNHIPIILLTARAHQSDKVSGLECGADAYLIKPFQKEELLVRIHNLLTIRQQLQQKYLSHLKENPPTKIEDKFLQKLNTIIASHLDDGSFSINDLCRQIKMSRSTIHKKIKALTGLSTTEYIRTYRLLEAQKLLTTQDLTIAEVAYQTGFNSPSWFTQAYKKKFGQSPNKTRK